MPDATHRRSTVPAVLALGFRPFFLLAGVSAVLLIPIWIAVIEGRMAAPGGRLAGVAWHAHEMIFGFAAAMVAGFLLTATPNWTATRGLSGAPLGALVALWLAGRVAVATATLASHGAIAVVDLLFLPAVALAIARPIVATRNRRNVGIPLLLLALAILDGAMHGALAGRLAIDPVAPLRAAVHGIALLMVVVGGRVTPLFTRNALGGSAPVRDASWIDRAAVAAAVASLACVSVPGAPPPLVAATLGAACVLNAARMRGWATRHTARAPLLWILHAGYGWLVVGYGLGAIAALRPDVVSRSIALHAFTAGALGSYGIGMMTRVSRGHTGRPLAVGAVMTLAFAAVVGAGALRVGAGLLGAGSSLGVLQAVGVLWCLAFGGFLWVHAPILLSPRPDGRPG